MKMTMNKINKMTVTELQNAIDKAENCKTIYTNTNKKELITKFIKLYNAGLIK